MYFLGYGSDYYDDEEDEDDFATRRKYRRQEKNKMKWDPARDFEQKRSAAQKHHVQVFRAGAPSNLRFYSGCILLGGRGAVGVINN